MHAQTRRQREVLDFIARYIDSHGYRPSYQLIARHMGVSSRAGIARIVHDLEAQGLLTRRREDGHFYIDLGRSASIAAGGLLIEWLDVPARGEFREPWQNQPFSLPDFMLGGYEPGSIRAFRVTDDGLAPDIREDDIALIELRQFARDGQRVVAILDDESAILRKYYRAGADIELCPADENAEIIRLAADRVEIKGVFRGLIRPII